jgi:uncharacterized integral membrane protein
MSLILAALTLAAALVPLWEWNMPSGMHMALAVFAGVLFVVGVGVILLRRELRDWSLDR